ncbi:DUF1643 domain-containing protein [Shinella zoogloeoides]
MRPGAPDNALITTYYLANGVRWKRTRQWSAFGDPTSKILPWIVLNPAGNPTAKHDEEQLIPLKRKGAGWAMAVLAWRWGFDGYTAYNVLPFETKRPADLPAVVKLRGREIVETTHSLVASDLECTDAVIAAWGSSEQRLVAPFVCNLFKTVRRTRRLPLEIWCIAQNASGTPRHPSRISHQLMPVRYATLPSLAAAGND